MTKKEAVQYATLHLDGVACQWWEYGLHPTIDSFEVFATKLLNRFERQDEMKFSVSWPLSHKRVKLLAM